MKFKKQFTEALDIGNEILAIVSMDHFILLHVNSRFKNIFGDEFLGKGVFELFPIDNRERGEKALSKRGRFKAFYEPTENNSLKKVYELQFLEKKFEGQSFLVLSINDASYKRELDSLSSVIKDLGDQKETLEKAFEEATRLAAAKSDFLANMSHELRTPMNGVLGMIDLLRDTNLDQSQKDMLKTIGQCSEGLLVILNDILDLSKMGSNEFHLDESEFSVWDLCSHIVQLSQF
ncbi:MAG: histidine kinase dimerization/phospho-acceptor domain-containing protein, partial [Bdellovibrionota bacterium]|nr:histidine kinase dimerization/phospho-acceptor domain-containing protein [Bdellovibrionota bacterium]